MGVVCLLSSLPNAAFAQAGGLKAPKLTQVVSQSTRAAASSLKLAGVGRVFFTLGVLLLVLLALYFWKRRKAKGAATVKSALPAPVEVEQPTLAAGALLAVWRCFLRGLPGLFGRSIDNFATFVVLGPATAGKTTAISRYTDWQRQARHGLPSETHNEHLQVYLSSRAVAIELSPSLLWDASPRARRAVVRLFQRLSRRQAPVVAVVLDVAGLQHMSPDAVRALADVMRAKIDLLSQSRKRRDGEALQVRVVLTHLDTVAGYEAFAEFARDQGIPLRIALALGAERVGLQEQLQTGLAGFGRYLSLALTRLDSAQYQAVLRFLRGAPTLLAGNLPALLTALFADDALSSRPIAGPIYLACQAEVPAGSNPFHRVALAPPQGGARAWSRPQQIAYATAALVCGWLSLGFVVERSQFRQAVLAMPNVVGLPTARKLDPVLGFLTRRKGAARLLPSFYGGADSQLATFFTDKVRDGLLVPRYRAAIERSHWPLQEAMCHLAVIHGGDEPRLSAAAGQLVRAYPQRWPERKLVSDYLQVAATQTAPHISLAELLNKPEREFAVLTEFEQRLRDAVERPAISEIELVDLQEKSRSILRSVQVVAQCDGEDGDAVREVLGQLYGPEFGAVGQRLRDADERLAPLRANLALVEGTAAAPQEPTTLTGLAAALAAIFDAHDRRRDLFASGLQRNEAGAGEGTNAPESGPSAGLGTQQEQEAEGGEVLAQGEAAHGESAAPALESPAAAIVGSSHGQQRGASGSQYFERWHRLVQRSRATELMDACVRLLDAPDGTLFGQDGGAQVSALRRKVTSSTQGRGLISSPAPLRPVYSRATYVTHVRPSLQQVSRALTQVQTRELVSASRLQGCWEGIRHRVSEYADAYRTSLDTYYDGFQVKASTRDDVEVLFRYLAQPVSPLTAFLETVHDNADLDFSADEPQLDELLQPIQVALLPYSGLNHVMAGEAGKPRALDVYLLRMEQIRARFAQGTAQAEGQPPAEATTLHERLGGSGQIALEALTSPDDNVNTWLHTWLDEARLWGPYARPFRAPITALMTVGNEDIERQLAEVWHHDVMPRLAPLMRKFPFTKKAEAEVTAAEIEQAFHPVEGMMMDRYHRFFEPVTRFVGGTYSAYKGGPQPPGNILPILNRVARLTHALWDDKGAPRELAISVRPIPFGPSRDRKSVLTLAYVRFGDDSLFNFNQRPTAKDLSIAWTAPQMSQVGVQLTDASNGQQRYPRSLGTNASYFSPLRLLEEGEKPPAGLISREPGGKVLTERRWYIPLGADGEVALGASERGKRDDSSVVARFLVDETLLDLFNFGELARADEVRFASATSVAGVRGGQ